MFGIAAYFAGLDWTETMSRVGYYSFGYPLLLIPSFLIFDTPSQIYSYSLYLNALLASMLVPFSYLLCKRFGIGGVTEGIKPSLIILFTVLTGANMAYSNLGLGEILLTFLTYANMLCFYKLYDKEQKYYWFILQAILLVAIFSVHMRTMGILIAAALVIVVMTLLKKVKISNVIIFFSVLLVGIIVNQIVAQYIKSNVYLGNVMANDMDSRMNQFLGVITEGERFLATIVAMGGQLFYLGVASFTLIFFSIYQLFSKNISFFKNIKQNKDNFDYALLFLLLSFLGTLAISSIAMYAPVRGDHFIYGRYNNNIYTLLLLYILTKLYKGEVKFSKVNIVSINVIFFTLTALVSQFYANNLYQAPFMRFNVINLSYFVSVAYSIPTSFYLAALTSIIVGLLILLPLNNFQKIKSKEYISLSFATGIFLSMFVAYMSAHTFYHTNVQHWNPVNSNMRRFANTSNEYKPVYIIENYLNHTLARWSLSMLQFELFDRTLRFAQGLEDIDTEDFYFIIESRYEVEKSLYARIGSTLVDRLPLLHSATTLNVYSSHDGVEDNYRDIQIGTHMFDLNRFSTRNATLTDGNWISNGTSGFAMFGPYIFLSAADYQVDIMLSIIENTQNSLGFVDIAYDRGVRLADIPLSIDDFDTSTTNTFSIPFSLIENTDNIEFRVNVTDGTILKVESVVLRRLS